MDPNVNQALTRWHSATPTYLLELKSRPTWQAPSNHEVGWNAICSAHNLSRLCPILHNFPESIQVGCADNMYRLSTSLDNLDPIEHFTLIFGFFPCSSFDRTTILPIASGGIIDCQSWSSSSHNRLKARKTAFVPAALHSWKQLLILSSFPAISYNSTRKSVKNCPLPLTINERTYVEQSYIMGKLQETIGNDNFINLPLM